MQWQRQIGGGSTNCYVAVKVSSSLIEWHFDAIEVQYYRLLHRPACLKTLILYAYMGPLQLVTQCDLIATSQIFVRKRGIPLEMVS